MTRHARIEIRPMRLGACLDMDVQGTTDPTQCVVHFPNECPSVTPESKRPHYLRLVAANGQVLATSETYASRRNARRAVDAWLEAFFQALGGDDPYSRPLPVVEFDADGNRR